MDEKNLKNEEMPPSAAFTGKSRVRRLQVSVIKDAFGKKIGYCASVYDERKPIFEKCGIKTKREAWEKLKKYKK